MFELNCHGLCKANVSMICADICSTFSTFGFTLKGCQWCCYHLCTYHLHLSKLQIEIKTDIKFLHILLSTLTQNNCNLQNNIIFTVFDGEEYSQWKVTLEHATKVTNLLMFSTSGWWFGTFLFFHSVGNVIIPTDVNSIIFQRGRLNHQNQIIINHH